MKLMRLALAVASLAFCASCGGKKKEATLLQRRVAANLASEAQFAMTVREYARAEGLLSKVVGVCLDVGDYWVSLGTARIRLGQRGAAKAAYRNALEAYENAAQTATDPQPALQKVTVLALLGRVPEARASLQKLAARFPANRDVRVFVDEKQLDRMLADPKFKEISL